MSSRSSRTGGTDSEFEDSMDSVSSDGGDYQDLPIIVDHAGMANIDDNE